MRSALALCGFSSSPLRFVQCALRICSPMYAQLAGRALGLSMGGPSSPVALRCIGNNCHIRADRRRAKAAQTNATRSVRLHAVDRDYRFRDVGITLVAAILEIKLPDRL